MKLGGGQAADANATVEQFLITAIEHSPAQIAHGLVDCIGYPDSRQRAGTPEPCEQDRLASVGLAGRAEEVAELVLFLASDRAGFISGTAVDIDGGLSVYRADA